MTETKTTGTEIRRLIAALERKTLANPRANREPPYLSSLMDHATQALLQPECRLPHYADLIQMDLEEAYDCLDAISDAIPAIRQLLKGKRYRGPVPEKLRAWYATRKQTG